MALSDPLVPRINNEPLPRGPLVGRSGEMTQAYRNWNEARGRHIGEILSGVNRNAENIVQLQTDYTAADGAVTSAYISADAVVASDAESARATLSTTLTAAYQAADATQQTEIDGIDTRVTSSEASITTLQSTTASNTGAIATNSTNISANTTSISSNETDISGLTTRVTTAEADITTNATAVTDANTARASADTILRARVGGSEASLVQNAFFQEEFSGTAAPPGWTNWLNGTGTWVTRGIGDGYAFAVTPGAGANQGVRQNFPASPSDKFLAVGEVRRTLGGSSLTGAGLLVQWLDSGGSEISRDTIHFATDETTSGVTNSAPDGVSRWEKEVTAPASTVSVNLYAMGHFSSLGSIAAASGFNWRECNLRPISQGEANVSINATAIADIEGNLTASYGVTVDANGRISALRLLSDGTTATAELLADKIYFGDNTVFEDTYNSFYTEDGTYRNRFGGPFPASGDLLEWYGPESVALNSETRTNGVFAKGTDGKVYYGTAELGGAEFSLSGDFLTVAEAPGSGASGTTSAYSMTVNNNDGAVTYKWYYVGGSTAITISSDTVNNPTFTATPGTGNVLQATWRCIAEDNSGAEAVLDLIVQISDAFP